MKKLFGFIDKRPLIWFHYLLLVGIVILGYFLSKWIGLMGLTETNKVLGWILLIILYYILLLVGDNLIHTILGVD